MSEQVEKTVEESTEEKTKLEVVPRQAVILEVKKNDFIFTTILPVGSQFKDAYDAVFETLKKIAALAKDSDEAAKKAAEAEGSAEVKKDDTDKAVS